MPLNRSLNPPKEPSVTVEAHTHPPRFSDAMMKHHDQEPCEGGEGRFCLQMAVLRERKSGQEPEVGTGAETTEECCLPACSLAFLYTPRLLAFGWHHPEWVGSSLIIP